MDRQNEIVDFVVELDGLDVVEDVKQVRLDRVRVARLPEDLQKGGIWYEEETWKEKTFPFQITAQSWTVVLRNVNLHRKYDINIILLLKFCLLFFLPLFTFILFSFIVIAIY